MKKYLMTGIAAVAMCAAFTSCSRDLGFETMTQEELTQQKYNQAFLNYIGGSIDPNQDWGFSATRGVTRGVTRSNPGENYPATHYYANGGANCNANEWADPNKEFGGWVVPDPLTDGQKLRVQLYFQANPNLTYEDPHLRHFFVQQVYKGKTDTGDNSTEEVIAADGSKYTSDNMNHLTVGQSNMHINNFNAGTCSTNNTVLDNGSTVNDGTYHSDEIMLMVNIDDTSCFGYHDSGSSNQSDASPNHNDKAALVSAAVIDAWAAKNGNPGEAVTDKWNRSFLGFDLAIKEGEQAYAKDNAGNVIYATYDQAAESPKYAWDGEKIIEIADPTNYSWPIEYYDAYKTIMNVGWLTTNKNFYIAADQVNMSQTISINRAQASTLVDNIQNVPVIKDVMDGNTYYQSVINLPRIKQLVNAGYLPVMNKSLAEWVKVGKSDGYFSDWIVTLTEAQRKVDDEQYDLKIIAEDLSAKDPITESLTAESDFDFNDVVLEVKYGNPAKVKLTHAGGTLPLRINGDDAFEVHLLFDVKPNEMVNTGRGPSRTPVLLHNKGLNVKIENAADADAQLKLEVYKNGSWQEMTAPKGEPACKLAVGMDFVVLRERQSIKDTYELFVDWVQDANFTSKWW